MIPKMIKTSLTLILALGLAAPLSALPALAAGSQKQQCDRAVWDCVEKAKRMTCNRPQSISRREEGSIVCMNHSLCKGDKWWAAPGTTLAKSCPSGNQVVSFSAVDSAIERARRDMLKNCWKFHVFVDPNRSESDRINWYPGREQNESNCKAFADAFAQCLRAKAKLSGPKPHK